ncbi:DUF1059 domain-containing protein [Phaeobacter gallaeciensis]|uniref:DUF1059 domain-containing protein n=2 Tax=Roseobacteraceae TaxID=2854170 RepID=A0A366WWS4_9RHOB|nr:MULTISPECIES: DUF1059 domain-containing protein [Roseobacteraceae]MBT3142098.1 DUF1059 domain-containing protein [Falsiruegeria litorea]MBT8168556.1 DUF1059 domain-containing protein [Falsiruegeria litorea]RBW53966.1 DUF1059 domain-containing protein [Phaeobacter gallaeciensis]
MIKVLKCKDLMPGCDFIAKGETTQDVLQQAAIHAKEVHGIDLTPVLIEQVKLVIKDA